MGITWLVQVLQAIVNRQQLSNLHPMVSLHQTVVISLQHPESVILHLFQVLLRMEISPNSYHWGIVVQHWHGTILPFHLWDTQNFASLEAQSMLVSMVSIPQVAYR